MKILVNDIRAFPCNGDMRSREATIAVSFLPNCLTKYVLCYNENSSPAVYVKII